MNKYNDIDQTSKNEICSHIYNNYIVKTSDLIENCQTCIAIFKSKLPISCYTNFRDALFHFYKMNKSTTEIDVYTQAFAISEHLSRASTDATNSIFSYISSILEGLIRNNVSEGTTNRSRELLHKVKEVQLLKRLKGMMMFDANLCVVNSSVDEAMSLIDECCKFFVENHLESIISSDKNENRS